MDYGGNALMLVSRVIMNLVPKIVSKYTHADKQTTDYYNPSAHAHMH